MISNVLSIAGVDPSGGAGLLADLKTFSALGAYGTGVVVALTAQNTQGVTGVHAVPVDFIARQIDTLFADVHIDSLKLGMLGTSAIAETVAAALHRHGAKRIVVDPVMVAKGGHRLLADDAVETVRRRILPLAEVLTPNLPETAVLLGGPEPRTLDDMRQAARALRQFGPRCVLVKGGHLDGPESIDLFDDGTAQVELRAPRVATRNTHSTGCTLSAAIAALLPQSATPLDAVRAAKDYLTRALTAADGLAVGSGHGPVHHFHALWPVPPADPR